MGYATVFVHDQHEFSIKIYGLLNNHVELKIDGIVYSPLGKNPLWDNALFFEYIIPLYNQKRKISIVLLKNRIMDVKQSVVVVFEGDILHGMNSYQEYRTNYYKHTIKQKELATKKQVYRILILEWKKALGYFVFGLCFLFIFDIIRPLVFLLFGVGVAILFSVIGLYDDKKLLKDIAGK